MITFVIIAVAGIAAGYGFRGLIHKDIVAAGANPTINKVLVDAKKI